MRVFARHKIRKPRCCSRTSRSRSGS
jgi:hypothetical protein